MKVLITISLFAISLSLQAQQVSTYEIDVVAKDSFFLVERITVLPTRESPRAQTSETNQLFRSVDSFNKFVVGLKEKARVDKENAEKQWESASKMEEMASKIEAAAAKVSNNKGDAGQQPAEKKQ